MSDNACYICKTSVSASNYCSRCRPSDQPYMSKKPQNLNTSPEHVTPRDTSDQPDPMTEAAKKIYTCSEPSTCGSDDYGTCDGCGIVPSAVDFARAQVAKAVADRNKFYDELLAMSKSANEGLVRTLAAKVRGHADAVAQAVQAEREACASIASGWDSGTRAAAQIRARGEAKP